MPSQRSHHYTFIVLLEPSVKDIRRIQRRNPSSQTGKPCAYVAVKSKRPPEDQQSLRRLLANVRIVANHAIAVESESVKRHTKLEGALSRRERLVREYRDKGWTVTNAEPRNTHYVYIVELKIPSISSGEDEIAFYVGQTGLTHEQRFERHRQGRLSNRQVQQYGVRLRQDLIDNVGPMTHLESLRLERQLYGRLQSNGYRVYGGH